MVNVSIRASLYSKGHSKAVTFAIDSIGRVEVLGLPQRASMSLQQRRHTKNAAS